MIFGAMLSAMFFVDNNHWQCNVPVDNNNDDERTQYLRIAKNKSKQLSPFNNKNYNGIEDTETKITRKNNQDKLKIAPKRPTRNIGQQSNFRNYKSSTSKSEQSP